jgi:alpha-mannosidase
MMPENGSWGYFSDGTIHLICSSHNDIAWFDTPAATIAWRDEKSITPALEQMANNKNVRFSMENVLYLLEYLERHPERKAEIHQLALEKRFDWGATYNQPYESLLSGEQLVRQTYFGRRLVRKLLPGADARVYYSPDVPGRAMQMPQILAKSGIPYMLFSRHKPSVQYWYSPDGSRIMSWSMGQYGTIYNFGYAFREDVFEPIKDFIHEDVMGWTDEYTQRKMPPHYAYLWSHDYTPPKDFDFLVDAWGEMRKGEAAPSIQYSTPEWFLDAISAGNPELEEICGERPDIWLYIHGPTHHRAISAKRDAGILLPAAEMFSTVEALLAGSFAAYPTRQFDRAWSNAIYDDHGWGGNNGHITDEVFLHKLERARDLSDDLLTKATTSIASRIKPTQGTPIAVFNALSWQRTDPVRAVIPAPYTPFKIVDDTGASVPYQRVVTTTGIDLEVTFVAQDVPPVGYKTYSIVDEPSPSAPALPAGVNIGTDSYENSFYRVTLAPGGIRSLYDKRLGKEVLTTEKLLGAEVVMLDSVGNGAGEFGSVQQPTTVGDYERASQYGKPWEINETGSVYTVYSYTQQLKYALLVQKLVFYHALDRIDVEIAFYNWIGEKSREYRMMLPVNAKPDALIAYEVPMGVVEVGRSEVEGAVTDAPVYEGYREDGLYVRGPAYLDRCADVHPREVQNWISAVGDEFAVTMSSSVAVADYIDPSTSVAPYPILQPILLASRRSCHGKGNWYLQGGEHHYRFSIFSHAADWRAGRQPATAANHDLRAVVDAPPLPSANLPPSHSFASVSADNLVITALKKAEDDDSVVVRLVDMEGKDAEATVRLSFPVQAAEHTNMIEEEGTAVSVQDGALPVQVGHHAIETYKVTVG